MADGPILHHNAHQAARDAAAEVAYPDDRHGAKTGRIWGSSAAVIVGGATPADLSWNDGTGACVGHDPDLWFPAKNSGADAAKAKAICAGCRLLEPCRQYGLDHEISFGIFGGLSPRDRREVRMGPIRRPLPPITHGTNSGYMQHYRRGETPCAACVEAHAQVSAATARRRRANAQKRKEQAS